MAILIKNKETTKIDNTCITRKMTEEEIKKYSIYKGSGIKVKKINQLEGYLL